MLHCEIAFAKQALTATTDWDIFQAILRKCFTVPSQSPARAPAPAVKK